MQFRHCPFQWYKMVMREIQLYFLEAVHKIPFCTKSSRNARGVLPRSFEPGKNRNAIIRLDVDRQGQIGDKALCLGVGHALIVAVGVDRLDKPRDKLRGVSPIHCGR